MQEQTILDELKGGDRRSIGRSNHVVAQVRHCPLLLPVLIQGMQHPDELVRMRAADAAEKLTVTNPEWLQPFRVQLIQLAAGATQQELKWHLAQILPRLEYAWCHHGQSRLSGGFNHQVTTRHEAIKVNHVRDCV